MQVWFNDISREARSFDFQTTGAPIRATNQTNTLQLESFRAVSPYLLKVCKRYLENTPLQGVGRNLHDEKCFWLVIQACKVRPRVAPFAFLNQHRTFVPCVRVTSVFPTVRCVNMLGALTSYQSFLEKGSTLHGNRNAVSPTCTGTKGRLQPLSWSACREATGKGPGGASHSHFLLAALLALGDALVLADRHGGGLRAGPPAAGARRAARGGGGGEGGGWWSGRDVGCSWRACGAPRPALAAAAPARHVRRGGGRGPGGRRGGGLFLVPCTRLHVLVACACSLYLFLPTPGQAAAVRFSPHPACGGGAHTLSAGEGEQKK